MSITSDGSYFEDFTVGDTLIHQRGRTITEADNHNLTSLVMNTAELHFNQDLIDKNPDAYVGGKLLVYGGVVLAFTVGLDRRSSRQRVDVGARAAQAGRARDAAAGLEASKRA